MYNEKDKEVLKGKELIRQVTEQEYLHQMRADVPDIATKYLTKQGRRQMCPHLIEDEEGEIVTASKQQGQKLTKTFELFGSSITIGYHKHKCLICGEEFLLADVPDLVKNLSALYSIVDLLSISEFQARLLSNPAEVYKLQTSVTRGIDISLTRGYLRGIKELWNEIDKKGVDTFRANDAFEETSIDTGLITPEPKDDFRYTSGLVSDKNSNKTFITEFK